MDNRRVAITAVLIVAVGLTGCIGGPTTDSPDTPAAPSEGTLEVHTINVGQAASTLIVGPEGDTILIDTGDFRTDGEQVLAYLEAQNIDRIDYLVTSHPDADHIGGHANLITTFETEKEGIGAIYDPGSTSTTQTYARYLDAVEQHNVTLYESHAGDTIPIDGATAQVLGPPEGGLASGDPNENSLVVRIQHGNASFLFTGDAESAGEQYLIDQYGAQLQSTVMKAGHHGSSSSTGEAILDTTAPQLVLISAPYDSPYGHPNDATLQRLADRDIQTAWTATQGNIVLRSNGTHVTVNTQQAGPMAPLALREGTPIEPSPTPDVTQRAVINASGGVTETTPVAPDGGTESAPDNAAGLAIAEVHADAAGNDRENLNDEYVVFENTGDTQLDLSGWTVSDAAGATYTVPQGTTLDAGATITLHTGSGSDTVTDLYWGSGQPIWNNGGDTVTVTTADGEVMLNQSYA